MADLVKFLTEINVPIPNLKGVHPEATILVTSD